MTYGTRVFRNGSHHSYLIFTTGKTVKLNKQESLELALKIKEWQYTEKLKQQVINR